MLDPMGVPADTHPPEVCSGESGFVCLSLPRSRGSRWANRVSQDSQLLCHGEVLYKQSPTELLRLLGALFSSAKKWVHFWGASAEVPSMPGQRSWGLQRHLGVWVAPTAR